MGRAKKRKTRDKNKSSLPQVPKNMKRDNLDSEFSEELMEQTFKEGTALFNAWNPLAKRPKK